LHARELETRPRKVERAALHGSRCLLDLRQHGRKVDSPVFRGVRAEASNRFRELPLAADAIAAPGLVPRDRNVNKALEKVALGRLAGSPGIFELLVRSEVFAGANQLEPALERVRGRASPRCTRPRSAPSPRKRA
jgi:hypothetical protein